MPSLSDWTDDDLSRFGANVAEVLDLGRYYGDLDPQLMSRLSSLDEDITRAEEERQGQREDAAIRVFDALNDGEISATLLASATLAGLGEAHAGVLDSELALRMTALMADLLAAQRDRRRKFLKEGGSPRSGTGSGTEITGTGDEGEEYDDVPVP